MRNVVGWFDVEVTGQSKPSVGAAMFPRGAGTTTRPPSGAVTTTNRTTTQTTKQPAGKTASPPRPAPKPAGKMDAGAIKSPKWKTRKPPRIAPTIKNSKDKKRQALLATARLRLKRLQDSARVAAKRATTLKGDITVGAGPRPKATMLKARLTATSQRAAKLGREIQSLTDKYAKIVRQKLAKRKATKVLGDIVETVGQDPELLVGALRSPLGQAVMEVLGDAGSDPVAWIYEGIPTDEGGSAPADGGLPLDLESEINKPPVDDGYWRANPYNTDQTRYEYVPADAIEFAQNRPFPNMGIVSFKKAAAGGGDGYYWLAGNGSTSVKAKRRMKGGSCARTEVSDTNNGIYYCYQCPPGFRFDKSGAEMCHVSGPKWMLDYQAGVHVAEPDAVTGPSWDGPEGASFGPIVGNWTLSGDAAWVKGLRYAYGDKAWFWSPLEAPDFAKNEALQEDRNAAILAQKLLEAQAVQDEIDRLAREKTEAEEDRTRARQWALENAERQRQQVVEDDQMRRQEEATDREWQRQDAAVAAQEDREWQRQMQMMERFQQAPDPYGEMPADPFGMPYQPPPMSFSPYGAPSPDPFSEAPFEEGAAEEFFDQQAEDEQALDPTNPEMPIEAEAAFDPFDPGNLEG